jgi:hypothetical protein
MWLGGAFFFRKDYPFPFQISSMLLKGNLPDSWVSDSSEVLETPKFLRIPVALELVSLLELWDEKLDYPVSLRFSF